MRSVIPLLAVLMLTTGRPATASELVLPSDQYTSEKARHLATAHSATLRDLGATIYNCYPWLEVQRHSIGFFKPKYVATDERYLSVRVFVDQEPSARFAKLARDERAAAMFSRYVGDLVRRMARNQALVEDQQLAGFNVIVGWLKPGGTVNGRPVHETIAVFVEKPTAVDYVTGRIGMSDVARRARVLGFDGETPVGEMRLAAWDDDFISRYQVKGYEPPAGMECRVRN
jgi:hypothetical protein